MREGEHAAFGGREQARVVNTFQELYDAAVFAHVKVCTRIVPPSVITFVPGVFAQSAVGGARHLERRSGSERAERAREEFGTEGAEIVREIAKGIERIVGESGIAPSRRWNSKSVQVHRVSYPLGVGMVGNVTE
jgi:hypothetical protein